MKRISVVGAGNWGTVLALLLEKKGCEVSLWVYDPEQARLMLDRRENPFLPGHPLPEPMMITTSVEESVRGADAVVFAVRSKGALQVARDLQVSLAAGVPIITATKGLDGETGLTMSQVFDGLFAGKNPILALSGPNIAAEIAKGVPTATVIACTDEAVAHQVQSLFMSPSLRVYTNTDVIGVEIAGALKNIIAIAAGICDGMGFGDNTKAALLTRGLAEITRLGLKLGAQQTTFMGLAGIGDLMVTCASPLSRNHRAGIGLGEGRKLADVLKEIGQVAEGVPTTRAASALARKHGIPMPITEQVYKVLFEDKDPHAALTDLMTREPKDEVW